MSAACGRARAILWPDRGPRTADEPTIAARRHVEECAECRAFFADMAALRDAARALGEEAAPVEVREAVYARLARERSEGRRGRRWLPGAAAVLALALVGTLAVLRSRPAEPPVVELVAAEHARAQGGDRLASDDPAEVERWLTSRVAFAVHVPALTDARLSGARLADSEHGRGAVVEYVLGGRAVSYFVLPSPEAGESGPTVTTAARRGYRIAVWRDAGLVHAMVGDVPEEDLVRLARECIEQARGGVRLAHARLVVP